MKRRVFGLIVGVAMVAFPALVQTTGATAQVVGTEALVSEGSPTGPFSQNKQNEPAVAVDAHNPSVLAAGANDNIDMEACNAGDDTTCPFTDGVGGSGVYFSFDSGKTWTQPEYTGYSARGCLGVVGPDAGCTPDPSGTIGTLPNYYENGLVSDGDPALAFGPQPGSDGSFSWDNGSRLYYANLSSNFPGTQAFKGFEAVAVSRTDDVEAAASGENTAWMDPVIVTKQSSTTFSDKEQIWADNASSSPFFGNVYVCLASFRSLSSGNALPTPLIVATSSDGGDTWTVKQVTDATNNPFNPKKGFGRSGCTIRTDSNGVVYVMANQFAVGTPGNGAHILIRSFNGGKNWTRPETIAPATDTCFYVDPVLGRCVMDGIAGARDDLSSSPSLDIANGAPDGSGATDVLYDTWVDGSSGSAGPPVDNTTQIKLMWSDSGGDSWSDPTTVPIASGDRPYYAAVALSPDGSDAYLVYNAFTTPFQDNTSDPRGLVGVVLHADVAPDGTPSNWTELHRGAVGDPRTSSQNNLVGEFLGDYVYAAATNDFGVAVWNDVRNGADCPAMDTWRAFLRGIGSEVPTPAPEQDCPATWGNTDIFGFTTAP
ncbi:MAG TPA: sialidase family protein [Actinomycetota bacterium]